MDAERMQNGPPNRPMKLTAGGGRPQLIAGVRRTEDEMIEVGRILATSLALLAGAGLGLAGWFQAEAAPSRGGRLGSNCASDALFEDGIPTCGLVIDLPSAEMLVLRPTGENRLDAVFVNCCVHRRERAVLRRFSGRDFVEIVGRGTIELEYRPGWPPLATARMQGAAVRVSYANEGIDEVLILREVCSEQLELTEST